MIIIVEGIDRVGKTTLCKKLSEELGIPIHKYKGLIEYNKMNNTEETDKILSNLRILNETKSNIIFDRLYMTDYVYGNIERNYNPRESAKNLSLIENEIKNINDVILIYVVPTDINESSKQHGKDLKKYDELFYNLFKESKIENKFRCNYNTMNEAIIFSKSIINKEGK